MRSEPKTIQILDIIDSINEVAAASGLPVSAFSTTQEVVEGFDHGDKTKTLVFSVRLQQSHYRRMERAEREALEKRLRQCSPGGFGSQIFKDGERVLMKVRESGHRRPVAISLVIENDEEGRPNEVVPDQMFPDVRSYATAPLDATFGIHMRRRDDLTERGRGDPFTTPAVMSALVVDPIWNDDGVQVLPLPPLNGDNWIEHVRRRVTKIRPEDKVRAVSWLGALRIAAIYARHREAWEARSRWVDEHGKYESIDDDTGTSFFLPNGGPTVPDGYAVARELASTCASILDDLHCLQGTEATLSFDLQSMNTLKELHAISLGLLTIRQPALHSRYRLYHDASRNGKRLIGFTAWPL